ncbi:MAG: EAL domain-containing protein [Spirochaetota bacterium]|nr:EAL domain-containing protein [Spirochaetota bacterium]
MDPGLLKVEITETSCVNNIQESIAHMQTLNDLGIRLYSDDFGTGQSSLQYLKQLPAQVLKIDREFVKNIDTDKEEKKFLSHIVQIVKSRGKQIVAEGVDSATQAEYLTEMGCDLMQGFYFSEPLAAADFEALLEKNTALPL